MLLVMKRVEMTAVMQEINRDPCSLTHAHTVTHKLLLLVGLHVLTHLRSTSRSKSRTRVAFNSLAYIIYLFADFSFNYTQTFILVPCTVVVSFCTFHF